MSAAHRSSHPVVSFGVLSRSGQGGNSLSVSEIGAGLALGALVAFASVELLLGRAPIEAEREDVIATWVDMVMGLASTTDGT